MNAPTHVGNLSLVSQDQNSATYTSFGEFDFQSIWATLQNAGATSINILPNTDTESVDIEVFFGDRPQYAAWQWSITSICGAALAWLATGGF